MYFLKEDKKDELKSGRTYPYLANMVGLTDRYLKSVFAGERCKKSTAILLISARHGISVENPELESYLDYYFTNDREED